MKYSNIIKMLAMDDAGIKAAYSNKFKALPLSADNFKIIKESVEGEVFAVDGGSAVIVDGGAWILSKIKVGVVKYGGKKRLFEEIKNYYAVIINKSKYEIRVADESGEEVNLELPDFNQFEIDELPAKIMKILEWKECERLCSKDSVILMDSPLEADNEAEERIIKSVEASNSAVVGFCKTSRMRTTSGRSLLGVINNLSQKNTPWIYNPLYEEEELVNTFIAKLGSNAKFCHKIQLFKKVKDFDSIFNLLLYFAGDSETRGYPYPLFRADKVARINSYEKSNEVNAFEREIKKTELASDVLSQSFHSELDTRMYRK